eukprot:3936293-Rhodomonas_salina.3
MVFETVFTNVKTMNKSIRALLMELQRLKFNLANSRDSFNKEDLDTLQEETDWVCTGRAATELQQHVSELCVLNATVLNEEKAKEKAKKKQAEEEARKKQAAEISKARDMVEMMK